METHRWGADGRRIFTAEFKQAQIARVVRGEVTLAELARELTVSPSVVRRWQRLSMNGSAAGAGARQSRIRNRVQPEAHPARDGAEWLEAPARHAAAYGAGTGA
jgi:transposase-like protein